MSGRVWASEVLEAAAQELEYLTGRLRRRAALLELRQAARTLARLRTPADRA